MKIKNLLVAMAIIFTSGLFAQEKFPPTEIITGTYLGKSIPLRDVPIYDESESNKSNEFRIVENHLRANEKLVADAYPQNGIDPLRQQDIGGVISYGLEENFDGLSRSESGGALPPDPTGAVGPNHYLHASNFGVKVFDKSGNVLLGPVLLGSFMGSGNNSGDPIAMYDQLADRYFISQFGAAGNSLALAVSETNDPTGSYYLYQYIFDGFPDYPHYSVWPDGYYLTANKIGGNSERVWVIERDVILVGGPNPQIAGFPLPGIIGNSNTVFSPEPANLLGTTHPVDVPGYVVYLQDDGWSGAIPNDHLKVWEIEMDWVNIGNSTISNAQEIPTDPFDSVFAPFGTGDVQQPGTNQKIDMIGGIISYASNYRSFGGHNSFIITFNVDVDGNDTSGVRWIELRNTGNGPFSLFQEGTYAPADGHSRFMGSAAIDAAGNIGLGFNIASATLPVGVRYTGRYDGDPLGTMTIAETNIVDGIAVQTISNRFGDYSHLTMDPDNFTFWHTAEYFPANNQWMTRVAAFTLSGGFAADVGVNDIIAPTNGVLTNSETVEISIRNFGSNSQGNFPVELRVDGNLVATENYTGTINAGEVDTFTFAQTVDLSNSGQTYTIEATTMLGGDEFNANDAFSKDVTHLLANDVGAIEITAPVTGSGLGASETISVTIKNFGASTQSNFDVQYVLDGEPPVIENFAGPIDSEEEITFDFAQTGDFSDLGPHTLEVSTSLGGDQDNTNDAVSETITNQLCQPSMDCSFGDGFQLFSVAEINNPSGCEGYADFTNLVANLEEDSTYDLTVTTGYGDQYVTVWIDFNNDYTFTSNEKVVDNHVIAPGQGSGTYTETFDLVVPAGAANGMHIMRAKTNWQAPVPPNACEETQYGETEDYSAMIGTLGVDDISFNDAEMIVTSLPNNNFDIKLITDYEGDAYMAVYNMLGQQLKFKSVYKDGSSYDISLDMSAMSSGVYVVKVGSGSANTSKTARIIVR